MCSLVHVCRKPLEREIVFDIRLDPDAVVVQAQLGVHPDLLLHTQIHRDEAVDARERHWSDGIHTQRILRLTQLRPDRGKPLTVRTLGRIELDEPSTVLHRREISIRQGTPLWEPAVMGNWRGCDARQDG